MGGPFSGVKLGEAVSESGGTCFNAFAQRGEKRKCLG